MANHEKRVELHLHTKFSAMDGLVDESELIHRAADEGWPAVAIIDSNSVQAFPKAQLTAEKYGVKVIYGLEAYCCDDSCKEDTGKYHQIILLVKNKSGLKNLYELVSCAATEKSESTPHIPKSVLDKHRDGLLVGAAGNSGEVFNAVLSRKSTQELKRIAAYYDYLEIQPTCNNRFLICNGDVKSEDELRRLNIVISELAKRMKMPFIATGDVRFLDREDEIAHSVLLHARGVKNANIPLPLYYKSTKEMLEEFTYLGEAAAYSAVVKNTNAIADSIEPVKPVPQEVYPPKIAGAEDEIGQECIAQAERRYGKPLPSPVKEALDWELSVVRKNGFESCFAIAKKLVNCSRENGFTVGTRGAVAASLVAYLLGITEVNPLCAHYRCGRCRHSEFESANSNITGFELPDKVCPICGERMKKDGYNIPAVTFFAEDGSKPPNFSLNFASDYQEHAIGQLKELFGQGHILKAGFVHTISSVQARHQVENYESENKLLLGEKTMDAVVSALCGVKCGDAYLPGIYFVIPKNMEVADFCPVYKCSGKSTTCFHVSTMNKCLIHFEILGHDTPTLLKELEEATGTDSQTIPLDDKDTLRMFEIADTAALPEFGSNFAMQLLKIIKPASISELIKISGFIHGAGAWEENAENLLTDGTASISEVTSTGDDIFIRLMTAGMNQHDAYAVMEYVQEGRFYTSSEIEYFGASAKQHTELEKLLRHYKIPDRCIDSWKKIRYLFSKAHAAANTLPTFRIAWYKAHYPVEFYLVMLNKIRANALKPDDFWKKMPDLKAEITTPADDDDPMWKYGYESDRSLALKLICDAREHGMDFVPCHLKKHDKPGRRFFSGGDCTICVQAL